MDAVLGGVREAESRIAAQDGQRRTDILTLTADEALQHASLLLQGLGDWAWLRPSICKIREDCKPGLSGCPYL